MSSRESKASDFKSWAEGVSRRVIMIGVSIRTSLSDRHHLEAVPAPVVRSLRSIDLAQGRLDRLSGDSPAVAAALAERSRIESVIASNEIEGVRTSRDRAERLVRGEVEARSRDEFEIAGYRAALDDVYAHPLEGVSVVRLLHWHRELFRYAGPDVAGRFKRHENRVVNADGSDRFRTVSAAATPDVVARLVDDVDVALRTDEHHPVLIAALFTLDLLVVHPFEDGNGRTARVASNALLLRGGYRAGAYVSIEQMLNERRSAYYEALRRSTDGWHEGEHSVWPWAEFFAEVVAEAYRSLEARLRSTSTADHRSLVMVWLRTTAPTAFPMSAARSALAGVPEGTIRRALRDARDAGALAMRGSGRGTEWVVVDREALR